MKNDTLTIGGLVAALGFTFLGFFLYTQHVGASITSNVPTLSNQYRVYELLASTTAETTIATSTAATSTNITSYFNSSGQLIDGTVDIRNAKKVTLYFSIGGLTHTNTGTSTFYVQTSRDGVNWDYNKMLIPATSTSVTFSYMPQVQMPASGPPATTTQVYFLDVTGGYAKLRCSAGIVGTTEAGCAVGVTY